MGLTKKIKNAKRLLRQHGYVVLKPSPATDVASDIHAIMSAYDVNKVTKKLKDFFNSDNDSK